MRSFVESAIMLILSTSTASCQPRMHQSQVQLGITQALQPSVIEVMSLENSAQTSAESNSQKRYLTRRILEFTAEALLTDRSLIASSSLSPTDAPSQSIADTGTFHPTSDPTTLSAKPVTGQLSIQPTNKLPPLSLIPSPFPTTEAVKAPADGQTLSPTRAPSILDHSTTPSSSPSEMVVRSAQPSFSTIPPSVAPTSALADATLTPTQTQTPTQTSTLTPSQTSNLTPTQVPTQTPTQTSTQTPSQTSTLTQTQTPTQTSTLTPSQTSNLTPTQVPTQTPTQTSTLTPTLTPTQAPAQLPTQPPSQFPTQAPTQLPAQLPTQSPIQSPTSTQTPTQAPAQLPIQLPTPQVPTQVSTQLPTLTPSLAPISIQSSAPIDMSPPPIRMPTVAPSALSIGTSQPLTVSPMAAPFTTEPEAITVTSQQPAAAPYAFPTPIPYTIPTESSLTPNIPPTATVPFLRSPPSLQPASPQMGAPSIVPTEAIISYTFIPTAAPSVLSAAVPSASTPSTSPRPIVPTRATRKPSTLRPSTPVPQGAPSIAPAEAILPPTSVPIASPSVSPLAIPSRAPAVAIIAPTAPPSSIIIPSAFPVASLTVNPSILPTASAPSGLPSSISSTTPSIPSTAALSTAPSQVRPPSPTTTTTLPTAPLQASLSPSASIPVAPSTPRTATPQTATSATPTNASPSLGVLPSPSPSSRKPSPSPGISTPSPSTVIIMSLRVTQRFFGVSIGEASDSALNRTVQSTVAFITSIPLNQIKVESIKPVNITKRMRNLATSGKDVVYLITQPNGNATQITSLLNAGVTSGLINKQIQKSFPGATTTILRIQGASTTSTPTPFPSYSIIDNNSGPSISNSSPKISTGTVAGAAVAAAGFLAIMSVITYCFCTRGKRKHDICCGSKFCNRRSDRPIQPRTLILEELGCRSAEGTQSIFVMDNRGYIR